MVGETVDMKGKAVKSKTTLTLGRGAGRAHLRDTAVPSDRAPSSLVITPQQPGHGTLQQSTAGKQGMGLPVDAATRGRLDTVFPCQPILGCCSCVLGSWAVLGPDRTREPPQPERERTGVGPCCCMTRIPWPCICTSILVPCQWVAYQI